MEIDLGLLFGGSGNLGNSELTPEEMLKVKPFFEKNWELFQDENLSPGLKKMCIDIKAGRQSSTLAEIITHKLPDGREIRFLKSEL
jgi:hypothetical protein